VDAATRDYIRREIDRRKRGSWDAHGRRIAELADGDLLAALDGEWRTTSEVAERLGLTRPMRSQLGRRLQSVEGVEIRSGAGSANWTWYRRRQSVA
jgi:hypothetical protein